MGDKIFMARTSLLENAMHIFRQQTRQIDRTDESLMKQYNSGGKWSHLLLSHTSKESIIILWRSSADLAFVCLETSSILYSSFEAISSSMIIRQQHRPLGAPETNCLQWNFCYFTIASSKVIIIIRRDRHSSEVRHFVNRKSKLRFSKNMYLFPSSQQTNIELKWEEGRCDPFRRDDCLLLLIHRTSWEDHTRSCSR